jgi:uncharacterized flavoprotein (TIGR03862 family)
MSTKKIAVIGGGPAGLMAAEILINAGLKVDLYDAMPSVGRKFLMAGKGGMNISHAESFAQFLSRYGERKDCIESLLTRFTPDDLRNWVHGLGIDTFIGSSGRVFPCDMKAAPLLRAWLHRLRLAGVHFKIRHQWIGLKNDKQPVLEFLTPEGNMSITCDAVVLALGGASWKQLGSTGAWVSILIEQGVQVAPLKPANCGFDVAWREYFRLKFAGSPIKSVVVSATNSEGTVKRQQGEFVITENGVESGIIYSLSALLREEISSSGFATIYIDLLPDITENSLINKLSKSRGKSSMANYLRKQIGLEGVKSALLREHLSTTEFNDIEKLCAMIKNCPMTLISTRPLNEAISTAGGVTFEALDEHLMIKNLPGVFCAGEMLDWEAPTGGYLLTACFASGKAAALGVLNRLNGS